MSQHQVADAAVVASRAREIRRGRMHDLHRSTDRMFAALMVVQWIGGIVAALAVSPRTWIGATSTVHIHVWAAVLLGGLLSSLPVYLALRHPGRPITRHVIAVAQMLWSALLIHLMGGRIETHFHVFGSLAFLAFYRDWRVLITATVVVALDHLIRGVWWPQSVFGVVTSSHFRWIEHAAWVAFEDLFLVLACLRGVREVEHISQRQAELEREVAERKHAELQIEQVNNELHQRNKEMEQLVYTVSHDLKAPVVTMVGFLAMLKEDVEAGNAADIAHSMRHIQNAAERMGRLIQDLLELSRVGTTRNEPEEIDTTLAVRSIAEGLGPQAAECGATFDIQPDMPRLLMDRARLSQVFENLLTNAIKYGRNGTATPIEVGADASNGEVRFYVRDHGPGIAPEYHERVFGLFQRLHNDNRGTGVGLAIVARIMQVHGGRIWLESQPGQGATFWFTLPVTPQAHLGHGAGHSPKG